MKRFQVLSVVVVFSVVLAVSARVVSTVRAQDDQQPNNVAQLKQMIAAQEKRIQSLDSRVAKLEKTHKILRFDQYVEAVEAAGQVQPSGKPVAPKTQLKEGDRVLVEWQNTWWKGKVLEVLPGGDVKIHYVGWDAQFDEVVPRTRLQHPAKETANPKKP